MAATARAFLWFFALAVILMALRLPWSARHDAK
jgi:hypothetical protein